MCPPSPSLPIVLTFAASDPSGGAGLQADVMTIAAMGCHPLSVITALTVQDTVGVARVQATDADCVVEQARALLADMPVAAFKIGLLGSEENVLAIAAILAGHRGVPVVVDPVLSSGRGDEMVGAQTLAALRDVLLPLTTLLTPNTLEACRLVDGVRESAGQAQSIADNAQRLLAFGCRYVLVTGTHADSATVVNRLFEKENGLLRSDSWERLPGSYHGSGCTLASAIAASLARGVAVEEAVRDAQSYTWQALAAGFRPGFGQHIPDRFFRMRSGSRMARTDGQG